MIDSIKGSLGFTQSTTVGTLTISKTLEITYPLSLSAKAVEHLDNLLYLRTSLSTLKSFYYLKSISKEKYDKESREIAAKYALVKSRILELAESDLNYFRERGYLNTTEAFAIDLQETIDLTVSVSDKGKIDYSESMFLNRKQRIQLNGYYSLSLVDVLFAYLTGTVFRRTQSTLFEAGLIDVDTFTYRTGLSIEELVAAGTTLSRLNKEDLRYIVGIEEINKVLKVTDSDVYMGLLLTEME